MPDGVTDMRSVLLALLVVLWTSGLSAQDVKVSIDSQSTRYCNADSDIGIARISATVRLENTSGHPIVLVKELPAFTGHRMRLLDHPEIARREYSFSGTQVKAGPPNSQPGRPPQDYVRLGPGSSYNGKQDFTVFYLRSKEASGVGVPPQGTYMVSFYLPLEVGSSLGGGEGHGASSTADLAREGTWTEPVMLALRPAEPLMACPK
jgi:hypothetical protein